MVGNFTIGKLECVGHDRVGIRNTKSKIRTWPELVAQFFNLVS